MKLPASIQTYFDADKAGSAAIPLDAFAPDAIVEDEGKTHVGHDAIQGWWRAAKDQYQHTTDPFEIVEQKGFSVVRARVTGRFPGSPAFLTFAFQLAYGRISRLEISA